MAPALFLHWRIGLHLRSVVTRLERVHETHAEPDAVVFGTIHQTERLFVCTEIFVKAVTADRVERCAVKRRTLAHVIGIGQTGPLRRTPHRFHP